MNANRAKDGLPVQQKYCIADAFPLGRTAYHEDARTLWCSHAGSGVLFGFRGKEAVLHLIADSAWKKGTRYAARYAVYVNDERLTAGQLLQPEQEIPVMFQAGADGYAWVRVVKLSESMYSALGLTDLTVYADDGMQAEMICGKPQPHLIEFIGDSITCGYGIDGENGKDVFRTANENVTKAYGYLTAKALHADYSMVCFSGFGIISGYTETGMRMKKMLLPPFYTQTGHSSAKLEENRRIQDDSWTFQPQPDLVVINLGTNDASFTGTDAQRQQEFAAAYETFLRTVREKNPDAALLCVLGTMDDTLFDAVQQAAGAYMQASGDRNIRTLRLPKHDKADGFAVDFHPSAVSQAKTSEILTAFVREWLGWA